jgi:hypothetical protein
MNDSDAYRLGYVTQGLKMALIELEYGNTASARAILSRTLRTEAERDAVKAQELAELAARVTELTR